MYHSDDGGDNANDKYKIDHNHIDFSFQQVTTQFTEKRLHRQGSVQSSSSSTEAASALPGASGAGTGVGASGSGSQVHRTHEIVSEIAAEEVRK